MPANPSSVEYLSEREIRFTRVFDAPRELVWQAWTDPQQVAQWWGPKGFTITVHAMDVRPGGAFRFTMHGPDGADFPNLISYLEVTQPARLVYDHGDETNPKMFHVTAEFIAEGNRTKMVWRVTFPNAAAWEAVKPYAIVGHNSTMDRLGELLAAKGGAGREAREITSSRIFTAPRAAVFQAFRDPRRLAQWWGPAGFTNTIQAFDFRPGGRWRLVMHAPNGTDFANESEFNEVVENERVVFTHLEPIHRFQMTMLFADHASQTQLTWRMLFETADEVAKLKTFIAQANEQNFDRLAAHLRQTT